MIIPLKQVLLWYINACTLFYDIFLSDIVVMLTKERHGGHKKGLMEKHIYSSNKNKIQVNLVKQ